MKIDDIYEEIKAKIGDEEVEAATISLRLKDAGMVNVQGDFSQLVTSVCVLAHSILEKAPSPGAAFAFKMTMMAILEGDLLKDFKEFNELADVMPKGRAS